MATATHTHNPAELLELIEAQMKELRQTESLEAQIHEMVTDKRSRLVDLMHRLVEEVAARQQLAVLPVAPQGTTSTERAAIEAAPVLNSQPVGPEVAFPVESRVERPPKPPNALPARPFSSPGAPVDLLAQNGATPAKSYASAGASVLVHRPAAPQKKTAAALPALPALPPLAPVAPVPPANRRPDALQATLSATNGAQQPSAQQPSAKQVLDSLNRLMSGLKDISARPNA